MVAATKRFESSSDLDRQLWAEDLPREHGFEPLHVEGTLPRELRGTLYRNGPGLFGQFGTRYSHPFEGDGAITAVRLDGGTATGAARITQSHGLRQERAAGRLLYGLRAPWWRRVLNLARGRQKNTANTSVMVWQGRLLALMEVARPTELDPRDLSWRGETDLGGAVVSWFSAHPHRVAARQALYNFGLEVGRHTRLHTYELPDVGPARHLGAIELDGPPLIHDFIATETHLVFFVSPVRIDLPRMLLQLGSFDTLFQWRPQLGTEVICVPIDRPDRPVRFTTDPFFQWHFVNAFDRSGEIVVDYVGYPSFDSFHAIGRLGEAGPSPAIAAARGYRAVIDPRARRLRRELVIDRSCEFPTIAPGREGREHARAYLILDELRAIARADGRGALVTHEVPETQRVTEPLFVPRPGAARPGSDDDGWLLAFCHDGPSRRAFLAVYDAARLPDGPVARTWFDHQVPITFHGTYSQAAH